MSSHFSATIPMAETPVTVEQQQARDAMAYLIRHDATDLTEALGMTPYVGHNYHSSNKRTVSVVREGSAE